MSAVMEAAPKSPAESLRKRLFARVRPSGPKGTVLLTFDDGPDPLGTPRILDILDRFGARAIFFIAGKNIPKAPELLGEIVRRGHALGNHSFSHQHVLGYVSRFKDMRRCREEIQKHAGVRPRFYRPPLGHLDSPTLLARWIERTPVMLWSIDTDDWRLKHDPEAARARADAIAAGLEANPGTSEILLFHDWGPNTPMMLNRILPRLAKAGRPLARG